MEDLEYSTLQLLQTLFQVGIFCYLCEGVLYSVKSGWRELKRSPAVCEFGIVHVTVSQELIVPQKLFLSGLAGFHPVYSPVSINSKTHIHISGILSFFQLTSLVLYPTNFSSIQFSRVRFSFPNLTVNHLQPENLGTQCSSHCFSRLGDHSPVLPIFVGGKIDASYILSSFLVVFTECNSNLT